MENAKYLEINSVKIRYFDEGKGPVVVFLHGFCLSSEIYELFWGDLIKSFRCIAIDLPGHGGSDLIPGMHHVEQVATWINKVLNELEADNYVLVGHSLGGYIALGLIEKYQEKVEGLCMFHSTASSDSPTRIENRNKTINFVENHGLELYLRSFIPTLFHHMRQDLVERCFELAHSMKKEAFLAFCEAMSDRKDRSNLLELMEFPVLYIIGGHDELISKTISRDEMLHAQNGNMFLLEDAGHIGMYEAPEPCLFTLRNFLERCFRKD